MVFAFFSVSSSKLPSYILPIFPALAILVALHLARAGRALIAAQGAAYAVLGLAIALLAPQVLRAATDDLPVALLSKWLLGL